MAQCYSNIPAPVADDLGLISTGRPGEYFDTFTGTSTAEIKQAMDDRLAEVQRAAPESRQERRAKIGRNSPCQCGSGLKFKKCCMARTRQVRPTDPVDDTGTRECYPDLALGKSGPAVPHPRGAAGFVFTPA